jgi:hypothetical protein
LWAVARYDFGLTNEQFGELTPAMFVALLERRWQEFRRGMYGQAVVAAQNYNLHRPEDAAMLSAMDFIPGSVNTDDEKQEEVRRNVMAWHSMHPDATSEQIAALRTRVIAGLVKQGYEEAKATEMYDSIFAH